VPVNYIKVGYEPTNRAPRRMSSTEVVNWPAMT